MVFTVLREKEQNGARRASDHKYLFGSIRFVLSSTKRFWDRLIFNCVLKLEAALADGGACFFSASLFFKLPSFWGYFVCRRYCFVFRNKCQTYANVWFSVWYLLFEDEDDWSRVLILDHEHVLLFFVRMFVLRIISWLIITYILLSFLKKYGFHHPCLPGLYIYVYVCMCVWGSEKGLL